MSLAESATLLVNLNLGGTFNAGISAAEAKLGAFEATASRSVGAAGTAIGGAMSKAKGAVSGLGGALSHAGGQLKGLITGPLGLLGLGGAVFTLGGAIKEGLGKANEFSLAIEKLQGITGDSADNLARLIAVTDNYGISADRLTKVAGFAEKSLGQISHQAGGAAKFIKDYGFSITDASGKILPFHDILLKTADYYNSNASQSDKAALAAKLFGRSYADLVPVLKLGSKGITDAEKAAEDLGITLTATNVKDLAAYRAATRDLGDAMTGLQLQVGLALVPAFTDLAKSLRAFIGDHRTDIVAFFKNAIAAARTIGTVIGQVVGAIGTAWNAIPAPLRDFLVKGLVADRTFKFLFGFDPVASIGKGILGALGGTILSRGSPANPMFVVPVGGGLAGAAPSVLGSGLGSGILKATIVGAVVVAGFEAWVQTMQGFLQTNNKYAAQGLTPAETTAQKYYTSSPQDQQAAFKHLGYIPKQSDYASAQQKLGVNDDSVHNSVEKLVGKTKDDQIIRSVDFAKVEQTRAVDTSSRQITDAVYAVQRAVLSLGHITLQVTAASVTRQQARQAVHNNPMTMNRGGQVAT